MTKTDLSKFEVNELLGDGFEITHRILGCYWSYASTSETLADLVRIAKGHTCS